MSLRGLAVADEIVVDEIDHRRMHLAPHGVEFGGDLLRRLEPRLPAVEAGDVAELAQIRTAARELNRQHQVALERDEVVGRDRKVLQRQPLLGDERQRGRRPRRIGIDQRNDLVGGVAHLADMQVVDLGIHLGRRRGRRAAQRHRLAGRMRAVGDVVDLRGLHVHAADHHHIGPGEIGGGRGVDVFVDETDRPALRHVGGDQQQPLRRHERPHALHQPVGVVKSAEGRGVAREHTQDPPLVSDRYRTAHVTSPR